MYLSVHLRAAGARGEQRMAGKLIDTWGPSAGPEPRIKNRSNPGSARPEAEPLPSGLGGAGRAPVIEGQGNDRASERAAIRSARRGVWTRCGPTARARP